MIKDITVCVPLRYTTFEEVVNAAKESMGTDADMVEIWLDKLPFTYGPSRKDQKLLNELFSLIDLPIVCVNKFDDADIVSKIDLLCKAVLAGVDYIDVDINTEKTSVETLKYTIEETSGVTQLIISYHNFGGTPDFDTLKKVVNKAKMLGADIIKIATFANDEGDNDTIFKILDFIVKEGKKGVCMCMGDLGTRSRIEGCKQGSVWTYVALNENSKTAPGQLTINELNG